MASIAGAKTGVNVASMFMMGFSLALGLILAISYNFRSITEFQLRQGLEPGYPYLQAITMRTSGGEPFFNQLSEAVRINSELTSSGNITTKLMSYGESFVLLNQSGSIISSTGNGGRAMAIHAIPPGGSLIIYSGLEEAVE